MRTSAETVRFEGDKMWVGLSDGRAIGVPLAWFPRLARATPAEREGFEITAFGIHWEALDEDVSVAGLLAGKSEQHTAADAVRENARNPEPGSLALRPLEGHERLWVWYDEEPSSFEVVLAECLASFPWGECDDKKERVLYVSIHSWRGDQHLTRTFSENYMPKPLELPHDRLVAFLDVTEDYEFRIPKVRISYAHRGKKTSIRIVSEKAYVSDQIISVIAARQKDFDKEVPSLSGIFDIVGLFSILSGRILYNRELAKGYFCTKRKKFISAEVKVMADPAISRTALSFADASVPFDARDERTHGALWFAGKAFAANDHASKIVFYRTALELIGGKQFKNYFGRIYRTNQELKGIADEKLSEIERLRGEVVHSGRRAVIEPELERYIQAAIIDGLRFKHQIRTQGFAMAALHDVERE